MICNMLYIPGCTFLIFCYNLATCDSGLLAALDHMFILCDIMYGGGSVYACMYLPYLGYRAIYPDQVLSRYGLYDTLHSI